jgi:hypothetical protein
MPAEACEFIGGLRDGAYTSAGCMQSIPAKAVCHKLAVMAEGITCGKQFIKTVIQFATTGGSKCIMVAELLLQRAQTPQDMPKVIALHACITRNPQLGVAACLSAQPCRHR